MNSLQINTQDSAFIAVKSLAYISQNENEMAQFITSTGIEPSDVIRLRENLKFLAGVLDFLSVNESLLVAFCSSENISPERFEAARQHLNGI